MKQAKVKQRKKPARRVSRGASAKVLLREVRETPKAKVVIVAP